MRFIYRRTSSTIEALKQFFILTVALVGLKFISSELTVEEEEYSDMTSQCILRIIRMYLNESKKISIRYGHNQTHVTVVEQLFRLTHIPIMTNSDEVPIGEELDTRIPSDVIIILGELTNVTQYLRSNLFTSRTVFLMVLWDQPETLKQVFQEFWKHNIVHIYALVVGGQGIDVYYFEPYAKCNEMEPIVLDHWLGNRFKYGKIERVGNKYPVSNLNGCQFNVSLTNLPPTIIFPDPSKIRGSREIDGIEGRILTIISEVLNCSFLYKIADDGEKWGFVNPSPKGVIGDVFRQRSIIGCGLTATSLERMSYLDGVVGCSAVSECVSWLVPVGSGKGKPVWIGIYISEFSLWTWILLSFTMISVMACYSIFSWITNSRNSISDTLLMFYSSSLGASTKLPKSRTLRILFAAWIWYALVVQMAYESSVKSRLTVPLSSKNIDTFKELRESDLELYGLANTIRIVFQGNEDPDAQALGKRVKTSNKTIEKIVRKMLEDRLTGYLREYTTFLYSAYKNREAIGEIHQVKRCALQYNPTLYLQKRSPITHVVRRVIPQLLESGILHHWRKWFLHEVSTSSLAPNHIKLTLRHIAAPFVACLVGLLLSIVLFILEHIKHVYIREHEQENQADFYSSTLQESHKIR